MTALNIDNVASFVAKSYSSKLNVMMFGPGKKDNEVLLQVPILLPGHGGPLTAIKVTAMIQNLDPSLGVDHDPKFGISDGNVANYFWVSDTDSYDRYPPCDAANAKNTVNGPSIFADRYPSTVTFYFIPYTRYGMCSVEHVAFVNVALFEKELDLSKKMFFEVKRHQAYETYGFYMLKIEVLDRW